MSMEDAFEYLRTVINDMYKEDDIESKLAGVAPKLQENKDIEQNGAKD